MEWTQDLSVGVEQIDNQHKELISRINAFSDAIKNGTANNKLLDVVKYLESYVITHFKDEEALQVRYNYPGYAAHKKLHQQFVKDVKEMREQIEKGITSATQAMVSITLSSWLLLHINKEDKVLGAFIRGRK